MSADGFQFRKNNAQGFYETHYVDHSSLWRNHASDLRLLGYGESVSVNGTRTYPAVGSSYWGIEAIVEGEGIFVLDGTAKRIRSGDVVFCPPDRKMYLEAGRRERMKKIWLLIHNDPLAEYLCREITNGFQEFVIRPAEPERTAECFAAVRELVANGHPRLHQELSNRIYILLNELRQYSAGKGKRTRFDRVLAVVRRSPQNFPDVESLAEAFGFPEQTLFRIFRERLGCSPMKYVIRCRLYNSCWELTRHEIPISTVAEMYGYRDTAFYIREFKKLMGMTPLQCRKAYQNDLPLPSVFPEQRHRDISSAEQEGMSFTDRKNGRNRK